ncbi:hypothetical protein BDN72DRAFT_492109 [Pluteus cervinus]|uniref:Uncharacterized protein n=1 Tax=Pluteus cervinus TaxID=181527 RepID=A0ACD3B085_9AGAR|nr:hypothetical protein BDN72DRAFT_492109 [Pluteus cervinus]
MSSKVLEHAHAREKIDLEILMLQERIRSLRSSRNALSLIHWLPPEVMTQIFIWLQSLYRGTWTNIPSREKVKSFQKWSQVTHVSRHWRNIAHSSKTLYSTVLTLDLGYAQEMLQISGVAPLSIFDFTHRRSIQSLLDNSERGWDKDLQELVVAALPRARNLWLGPDNKKSLLPHLEKSDLGLLEGLSVWSWDNVNRKMCPDSLRHLQLHSCSLGSYEWLSGLSNMVSLTLAHWTLEAESWTAVVDEILDALHGMPQLVSLELLFNNHHGKKSSGLLQFQQSCST